MHVEFRLSEEAKKTPSKDHRNADSGHSGTGFIKAPKMPYFDEDKDFMDSYLNRFEQFATSQMGPIHMGVVPSALLRGRALDVYSMIAKDDVNDYEKLKFALLKRYQLTADGFRKRFRTSRPEPGETPSQFITRIGNYLQRWIDLAKAAETYDGVKKLFIEEQYFQTCPKEMATHLKEGKPETLRDLAERAQTYLEAHSSDILFGIDPKFSKIPGSPRGSPPLKRCHNCGSTSHLRNQCPKPQTPTSPKNPRAPQPPFPPRPAPFHRQPSYGGFKPTSPPREPPCCFICNKTGHIARDCPSKFTAAMEHLHQGYYRSPLQQEYFRQQSYPQYHNPPQFPESDMEEPVQNSGPPAPSGPAKTTTPSPLKPRSPPSDSRRPTSTSLPTTTGVCRQHGVIDCGRCNYIPPTHHCQALIAICQDCGQQHPVVADSCQSDCKNINMPVADGLLENQPVQVLRDTGCSAVIVHGSLVSETKLTGQEARCVLIDGTIRRAPVSQVFLDTPYFTGITTAVCMENPWYDVIVWNIPGATNPTPVQPASAVQTRSQATATKDQSPVTAPLLDLEPEDTVTTIPRAKPFQEHKRRISCPPILRLPDDSQPSILQTDASHLGVREDTASEKRPIAFASRKLLPRESPYSTIERECLAITWSVKKF